MKSFPKHRTERSKKYLDAIRQEPCLLQNPDCFGEIVAHHEGKHGIGIKASDFSTLPLCAACHNLRHLKGPSVYGNIDIEQAILNYQRRLK